MRMRRAERNREVVLAAARQVFLDKGYAGATLEGIAEAAGFSKGVVYSQFESKADLFLTLLKRRIDERSAQNERVAERSSGAEGIRELVQIAARDATAERGWAALLVEFRSHAGRDPALNARYAQAHGRTLEELAGVLARMHDRGGLVPKVTPRSMAEFILAFASGITLERSAASGALPDGDGTVMVLRALGLPDLP